MRQAPLKTLFQLLLASFFLSACNPGFQTSDLDSSQALVQNVGSPEPIQNPPVQNPPLQPPSVQGPPVSNPQQPDATDMLTWMDSQLANTTYVAVHAEELKCNPTKALARYYSEGLGRAGSSHEINFHLNAISSGSNLKTIRQNFISSNEFLNAQISSNVHIQRAYQLLFGRVPSTDESNYYLNRLTQGMTIAQMVQAFLTSSEHQMSPDCHVIDSDWKSLTEVYQPFKTIVDRVKGFAYWRKDDPADFYGELFTFDQNSIYLRSETFPIFEGFDSVWDARIDKFRLFALDSAQAKPGGKGRLISNRKVDLTWQHSQTFNTYACYDFQSYQNQSCRLFQNGFQDSKVFIQKFTSFSTVFDGENPDAKWAAVDEFKNFDEVIVWNQEMANGQARERFFFGKKNGQYYGIIRWDNSVKDPSNNSFRVIHRTVGLKTLSNPNFSFKGMENRAALEK